MSYPKHTLMGDGLRELMVAATLVLKTYALQLESRKTTTYVKNLCSAAGKQKTTRELFGGVPSCVMPSLPAALGLLRQYSHEHPSIKLQVSLLLFLWRVDSSRTVSTSVLAHCLKLC